MKNRLLIDTCHTMDLRIDRGKFSWDKRFQAPKARGSEFHTHLHNLLSDACLELADIDSLIYCAGPGPYTGMRVSQGLAKICEWQGISIHSYYIFELAKSCYSDAGIFISNAYKDELFLYRWNKVGKVDQGECLEKAEAIQLASEFHGPMFIFENEREALTRMGLDCSQAINIQDCLDKVDATFIQDLEESNQGLDPFYYRSVHKEFKVTPKRKS